MTAFDRHPVQARAKAVLDPVAGVLLLALAAPVIGGIALWILLESGRPVLFVHPRAGEHGVPFRMFKFRTMVPNAVEVGRKLRLSEDPFGLVPRDPRITRGGRFLRRTGLDELPQLLNVVRGEMSLVGPRPDLVEQAARYTEEDRRRLLVKPGMTGWSQVHGRDAIPWPQRIEQDVWYIENWSLSLDLKIMFLTFAQLFRPEPEPVEDAMNIERARAKRAADA